MTWRLLRLNRQRQRALIDGPMKVGRQQRQAVHWDCSGGRVGDGGAQLWWPARRRGESATGKAAAAAAEAANDSCPAARD
jgi:hypothetical protein